MFTYFHAYMPETWDAQVRCGLINEHAGVRFCESIDLKEEYKFNHLAAVGTPFYQLMEETRMPMYIDRLQGGCFWEDYAYDWELVQKYEEMLGENFIGFQMHEWITNISSDLARIRESIGNQEWTEEVITQGLLKKFPYPHIWTEARSVSEYAKLGNPLTLEAFRNNFEDLFARRYKKCRGRLVPCDSYALAYQLEQKIGAKHIMPEVGAQIPDTRVQIAYARGMSRTQDIAFGVYYEPWGGDPFSASCYQRDGLNEWNIANYGPFVTQGENGGSSRSLQKRIHNYTYFAGASFISEEWGMCNTFYDWRDFELTPYGKIKYDFLQLVKKYPQEAIGTPYTPIAIVLSKDALPLAEIRNTEPAYLGYPITGSLKETTDLARKAVRTLLADAAEMTGCETAVLINSPIPDAFDIIHEDYKTLPDTYQYFVNCTGDPAFENTHNCCSVREARTLVKDLMPCIVEGNVHWFVNRTADGWLLVMFNHSGIHRSVAQGEYALTGSQEHVRIRIKNGGVMVQLEGDTKPVHSDDIYEIVLPSGGWFLGKF